MEPTINTNLSASAVVITGPGTLAGMYINSTNAGTIKIYDGVAAAGVKATTTLTIGDGGVIADGDTITLGTQTYTFKDALTSAEAEDEVLIGISNATALDNLKSAVDKSAGGGTTYGSDTVANASVDGATNGDTTQVFDAVAVGDAYNSVVTVSSNEDVTFTGATLAGGIDTPVLMNNTITPAVGYHNLGNTGFVQGVYVTIGGTALDVTLYTK